VCGGFFTPNIMTHPRNRISTPGAFGKPRRGVPAPAAFRGRRGRKPAPAAAGTAAPFNISNALIHFARPLIDQAGKNRIALQGAMNVSIMLWNAAIDGGDAIAAARETLLTLPGSEPEQVDEVVGAMVERKAELYPDVTQIIRDYSLTFNRRDALVRVVPFNIAPAGVEKSSIAGKLGPLVVPRERPPETVGDDVPPAGDAAGDAPGTPAAVAESA